MECDLASSAALNLYPNVRHLPSEKTKLCPQTPNSSQKDHPKMYSAPKSSQAPKAPLHLELCSFIRVAPVVRCTEPSLRHRNISSSLPQVSAWIPETLMPPAASSRMAITCPSWRPDGAWLLAWRPGDSRSLQIIFKCWICSLFFHLHTSSQ